MSLSVPDFSRCHAVVVGDVLLDRYWRGDARRISPEAPVPIVRVEDTEEKPGGAGNVAVNLAVLGARTTLIGVVGDDPDADALERQLRDAGVEPSLVRSTDQPTIAKLRVLSQQQQLIRLDFERDALSFDQDKLHKAFETAISNADVAIFSDYAKGTLASVPKLIEIARSKGVPVVIDPKGTDFTRYIGATGITPNRLEFEAVVGTCDTEVQLAERAEGLREALSLDFLLVTRGAEGMSLIRTGQKPVRLRTEARVVFDVTGAGDTVAAVTGAGVGAGLDIADAAMLANVAAGLVVARTGAASVSPAELRLALDNRGLSNRGVVTRPQMRELVAEARRKNERIVMTNGCFDIIHAGHVAYLEEARSLGDRLLIAVNDDASVRRLKGSERPVNSLAHRMTVLAGLGAVDWVVPFSEDTPVDVIRDVLPDILVKGGDYDVDGIVGADIVTGNGGEVRALAFRDGHSTSTIIEQIQNR